MGDEGRDLEGEEMGRREEEEEEERETREEAGEQKGRREGDLVGLVSHGAAAAVDHNPATPQNPL